MVHRSLFTVNREWVFVLPELEKKREDFLMVRVETIEITRPTTWSSETHPLDDVLEADLLSLLLEKKYEVTGYRLELRGGRLYQDEELFVEKVLARTLLEYTDPRFIAEKMGWENLEQMMLEKLTEGGSGWFAIASPPGETYRFKESKPMSATFLFRWSPDGKVEVFSLYQDEISPQEHWRRITITVPRDEWFELEDPKEIVATPVYIGYDQEMEAVLANFGIEGVEELRERVSVLEERVLSNDDEVYLVNILAERMRRLVPLGYGKVMDEVVITTISAWIRGKIAEWVGKSETMEDWVDLMIEEVLEKFGHKWEKLLYSYDRQISEETRLSWQGDWEELMVDPWFWEIYRRGVHGSGGYDWNQTNLMVGLDPLNIRLKKEQQEKQIECKKCHHQFVVIGEKKVRCPHCGTVIEVS